MAKNHKLPETIFVTKEYEGENQYLLAYADEADAVDDDNNASTTVGTYELVAVRRLVKKVAVVEEETR